MVVLDASAVLALLFAERGGDLVQRHLAAAIICAPNVTEVVTKLIDGGRPSDEAMRVFVALGLTVVPLDSALALRAGAMWEVGRDHGLSLADRACLALAEREKLPALTADRVWRDLKLGVEVQFIR
jgi:PIN domain nuclease of toxin-antitoxin system